MVPKYLVELNGSNRTPLQFMFREVPVGGLGLLHTIVLVLIRFNVSLLICNQLSALFNFFAPG